MRQALTKKGGSARPRVSPEGGFTFVSVLFAVTVMGIALLAASRVWTSMAAGEKEAELLFRGDQIRRAIGRYYEASPGAKSYPPELQSLIKDPRFPAARRHLRRIYDDPFTGKPDWELIKAPGGGIMGVRSASALEPRKKRNFPLVYSEFEDRTSYGDWLFVYTPGKNQPPALPPQANVNAAAPWGR